MKSNTKPYTREEIHRIAYTPNQFRIEEWKRQKREERDLRERKKRGGW